jgi:hypothetical protein
MRQIIINLLFRLLGQTSHRLYSIETLFGASTSNHETRKKRWERALARLWRDKDLLDYLYYQAESDKEVAWRGKIDKKLSQGARIRTMFIVYSAYRASLRTQSTKRSTPEGKDESNKEIQTVAKVYKDLVDIE